MYMDTIIHIQCTCNIRKSLIIIIYLLLPRNNIRIEIKRCISDLVKNISPPSSLHSPINMSNTCSTSTYHNGNDPEQSRNVKHQKAKVGQGKKQDEEPGNTRERVPGAAPPIATRKSLLTRGWWNESRFTRSRHLFSCFLQEKKIKNVTTENPVKSW